MIHINVFRVSTEELVWSGEYDPETTILTEALEASGVPDLAEAATQSHYIGGEGWWEVSPNRLRCRDFEALVWTAGEEQRGSATSKQEEVMAKREPPKPPPLKVETFTRDLKVTLTAAEVAERADRAARLLEDRDRAEAELKAHATSVKIRIATMEAEMRELSAEVRTKYTYREVECERRFLFATGCVQEVRLDTEEVISERAMTEKEKQRDLPFNTAAREALAEAARKVGAEPGHGGLFGQESAAE